MVSSKPVLLFAAIYAPSFNSDFMVKGFEECGFEVIKFDWQSERFNHGTEAMRTKLINLAIEHRPSQIFLHIQNKDALDIETVKTLESISPIVNFTFDVRSKQKTEWMYEMAKHVTLTAFACEEDRKECASRGIENVMHLHSSCNMDLYAPRVLTYPIPMDIVFVGNRYDTSNLEFPLAEERQEMIRFLQQTYTSRFRAFGLGQQGGMVMPAIEATIYNASKIAISHNNFERDGYTSDRTWRIIATGSLALLRWFPGIEEIFQKEVHCDWWKTFDELKNLIDYYLSDEKERKAVAEIGMNFVRENHTWKDRVCKIQEALQVEKMAK